MYFVESSFSIIKLRPREISIETEKLTFHSFKLPKPKETKPEREKLNNKIESKSKSKVLKAFPSL
jgi:hypothetical protein